MKQDKTSDESTIGGRIKIAREQLSARENRQVTQGMLCSTRNVTLAQ